MFPDHCALLINSSNCNYVDKPVATAGLRHVRGVRPNRAADFRGKRKGYPLTSRLGLGERRKFPIMVRPKTSLGAFWAWETHLLHSNLVFLTFSQNQPHRLHSVPPLWQQSPDCYLDLHFEHLMMRRVYFIIAFHNVVGLDDSQSLVSLYCKMHFNAMSLVNVSHDSAKCICMFRYVFRKSV